LTIWPDSTGQKRIILAVTEIISIVKGREHPPAKKSVPFSNATVSRRIDEIGMDVEEQGELLRKKNFSI